MENSEKEVSILIVEDDKYISNFICMSLKQEGYHYLKADTGREAIGLSYANNPDVVILDLGLPDMDGMEVIEHIRSNSDKPIIVVSARQEEGEKIKALDLGADDYVVKTPSIWASCWQESALLSGNPSRAAAAAIWGKALNVIICGLIL